RFGSGYSLGNCIACRETNRFPLPPMLAVVQLSWSRHSTVHGALRQISLLEVRLAMTTMRIVLMTLALCWMSNGASAAAKPRIYLWFEPEWFEGVKGNFAYWTGEAKPTGAWGIAGPGISPEWTQGGESEWNSMGAAAEETKAECHREFTVPRAGQYKLWVR